MASSFCFFAISVCAATAASLDSLSAAACATLMSRSLSARAIAALFLIFTMLSIPRFSMTSLPSTKFWTLKLIMVESHRRKIRLRIFLDQIGKLLAVGYHLLELHLTDDLTHITLKDLSCHPGNILGVFI